METKVCSKCKKTKLVSEFRINEKHSSGYSSWCNECCREAGKRYRHTIKGIYNAIKNRQRYLKRKGDRRAKLFTISFKEFKNIFVAETSCHYCHLPLEDFNKIDDTHIPRAHRMSVDCMDNDKGYVFGNIVLCCYRCNNTKNNFFSYEDYKEIAEKYITPMWEKQLDKKLS